MLNFWEAKVNALLVVLCPSFKRKRSETQQTKKRCIKKNYVCINKYQCWVKEECQFVSRFALYGNILQSIDCFKITFYSSLILKKYLICSNLSFTGKCLFKISVSNILYTNIENSHSYCYISNIHTCYNHKKILKLMLQNCI